MQYAVNLTTTHLGITGLKKEIPAGQWIEVLPEDVKHPEITEAMRKGWIKLSLTKPEGPGIELPKIVFSEPAVNGSKTIPTKAKKEKV